MFRKNEEEEIVDTGFKLIYIEFEFLYVDALSDLFAKILITKLLE